MNISKILVVDDEADLELLIRQKFRHRIRSNELQFEFASNGVEALQKLDNNKDLDMVLTDINMPVMDGLTLLSKIKEKENHYKAVVVSAYGDMENIRTAMNRGAFDFLTKPIDFNDLETTINKTLSEINIIKQGMEAKEQLVKTIEEKKIAELERSKAEEAKKFEQQFLANMSHEIRTPMNVVIGMTNLLLKTNMNEQQSKYINAIKHSSENLLVIINDILDLSKIEAGKIDFESIHFSLQQTVNLVHTTLKFKAEDKGLHMVTEIDPSLPPMIIGDPVRLSQVLLNLAGNAIKFTDKGTITIQCKKQKEENKTVWIEFSVTDTGIGIAEEIVPKIFESFTQASSDTTRKYGGTGLGLTISKQLVELQAGSIHVKSTLGVGSTFSFILPYQAGSEMTKEEKVRNPDPYVLDVLKTKKILLVEDNPFNQIVATDTIQDLIKGIQLDVADNGRKAVDMLRKNAYDLVIMDIQMPEMDGYEATKFIRSNFPAPVKDIPIMAMTANVIKEEIEKCFDSGMNSYIAKPFDPEDLFNKISSLLLKKE
ncbi:MAG TPA: response regulator [Bacteroidia bacterium]|nr:response regulator [Bacteroidia bacterium]